MWGLVIWPQTTRSGIAQLTAGMIAAAAGAAVASAGFLAPHAPSFAAPVPWQGFSVASHERRWKGFARAPAARDGSGSKARHGEPDDLVVYLAKRRAKATQLQAERVASCQTQLQQHARADVDIRRARTEDLESMQACNVACMPNEAYPLDYFAWHVRLWPQIQFVAEERRPGRKGGEIVGYVLTRMERHDWRSSPRGPERGHVVSLAVLPSHRKMGLGESLMRQVETDLVRCFAAECVSLNLRHSNKVARRLYEHVLSFAVHAEKEGLYTDADGGKEDGIEMRKALPPCQS